MKLIAAAHQLLSAERQHPNTISVPALHLARGFLELDVAIATGDRLPKAWIAALRRRGDL